MSVLSWNECKFQHYPSRLLNTIISLCWCGKRVDLVFMTMAICQFNKMECEPKLFVLLLGILSVLLAQYRNEAIARRHNRTRSCALAESPNIWIAGTQQRAWCLTIHHSPSAIQRWWWRHWMERWLETRWKWYNDEGAAAPLSREHSCLINIGSSACVDFTYQTIEVYPS